MPQSPTTTNRRTALGVWICIAILGGSILVTAFHDGWSWVREWYGLRYDSSVTPASTWVEICRGITSTFFNLLLLFGGLIVLLAAISLFGSLLARVVTRSKK